VVDYNKNDNTDDEFFKNTNLHDILNTQLQVVNDVVSQLSRGTLFSDNVQLIGNVEATPFMDRFENELAGWGANLQIQVANNISIC